MTKKQPKSKESDSNKLESGTTIARKANEWAKRQTAPERNKPIEYYEKYLDSLQPHVDFFSRNNCMVSWLQGTALLYARESLGKNSPKWTAFRKKMETKKGFKKSNFYNLLNIARNIPLENVGKFETYIDMLSAADAVYIGDALQRSADDQARNYESQESKGKKAGHKNLPNGMSYLKFTNNLLALNAKAEKLITTNIEEHKSTFFEAQKELRQAKDALLSLETNVKKLQDIVKSRAAGLKEMEESE